MRRTKRQMQRPHRWSTTRRRQQARRRKKRLQRSPMLEHPLPCGLPMQPSLTSMTMHWLQQLLQGSPSLLQPLACCLHSCSACFSCCAVVLSCDEPPPFTAGAGEDHWGGARLRSSRGRDGGNSFGRFSLSSSLSHFRRRTRNGRSEPMDCGCAQQSTPVDRLHHSWCPPSRGRLRTNELEEERALATNPESNLGDARSRAPAAS